MFQQPHANTTSLTSHFSFELSSPLIHFLFTPRFNANFSLFFQDEAAEAAKNAGANIVGGEELIKQVIFFYLL